MALDEIEPFPGNELTEDLLAAVDREERYVRGPEGAPDVRVIVYRPTGSSGTLPLIMTMHGGGFMLRADHFPAGDARLAALGAVVVSVDYRTVPDDPFPAGVEDCFAALVWAASELDIDPTRVVVTGTSAGGALCAAVAQMARDRGDPPIAFQALAIPVLHDGCDTPSMRQHEEAPIFGAAMARRMWETYLGECADRSMTSPYAAPGRAKDLMNLPPAFIQVNGDDPLRDEGIAYASALMAAGVSVELYCAPHQLHGDERGPSHGRQLRAPSEGRDLGRHRMTSVTGGAALSSSRPRR